MEGHGGGVRRALAVLLALIAAASFVVGAISLAARHTLYDPSNAPAVAARLLDERAVRLAIAEKLTNRIQVLDPQLREGTAPEGLEHLAELLTTTDPFRAAFTDAVVALQRDLLEGGAPQVVLRLDGMLLALQDGLAATGGDLGIPEDRLTGVLVVDREQVEAYRRLGDVSGGLGWVSIAIAVAAALGAVLISERRPAALLGVGAAIAAAALLALGGLALAKIAAAGQASSATGQDAVDAVWDAAARDVRTALAAVLLGGLAAAVAGLSMQAFDGRGRA
jgi:hypothetical protein